MGKSIKTSAHIYLESNMEYPIMFYDLQADIQTDLCEILNTTPEEENWDIYPIAIFIREEDE